MCDLQSFPMLTKARRLTPRKRGRPNYGRGVRHANCNHLFLVFQQFTSDYGLVSSRKAVLQYLNFLLHLALYRNTGRYCLQQNTQQL